MWQEIRPTLTKAAIDVVGAGITSLFAHAEQAAGIQPAAHGCVYCAITKALAPAHRYLKRAMERPELSATYRQLALKQMEAANMEFLNAPPPPAAIRKQHYDLGQRLLGHADQTAAALAPIERLEFETDITIELAMDLAEHVNSGRR